MSNVAVGNRILGPSLVAAVLLRRRILKTGSAAECEVTREDKILGL
jgi:hypothetical protein